MWPIGVRGGSVGGVRGKDADSGCGGQEPSRGSRAQTDGVKSSVFHKAGNPMIENGAVGFWQARKRQRPCFGRVSLLPDARQSSPSSSEPDLPISTVLWKVTM